MSTPNEAHADPADGGLVRLQKYLSDAGIASRRKAEELIEAGRVLINGQVRDTLPVFVDPAQDEIIVDGAVVRRARHEYFMVHKPKGVVCTNRDPAGRIRAIDLLPTGIGRLFVVGRLDEESTGLLLMTNDGELAERLTHPRYGIPKTYRVEVRGYVTDEEVQRLKRGVHLSEGKASATDVELVHRSRQSSILMISLREARNRQVRRMLARLSHAVRTLKRVQIGPLELRGLPLGASRRLLPRELAQLREATSDRTGRRRSAGGRKRRRERAAPVESAPAGSTGRAAAGKKPAGRAAGRTAPPAPRRSDGNDRPRRRVIS